ncbi:unnamed protein product, partial [Rotaria sordida]
SGNVVKSFSNSDSSLNSLLRTKRDPKEGAIPEQALSKQLYVP